MPVVKGQANLALCFTANTARSSLIVTSRPLGTCLIRASTSRGEGTTILPSPQRRLIAPETRQTLGRSLSSANFSRHDFLGFICCDFCAHSNKRSRGNFRLPPTGL